MVKSEPEAEDGPGPMPCKLPASSSSSPPCHDPISVAISSSSTTSAMSVFFNQCLCCSLLTGSVLTGVYATAVYIVAFAMEVWLITETADQLPTPSYILCVGYFITWTMSVAFLVGLALRRTKPILAWLLTIVVLFFPECGLVLFMSLYHWTLESSFGLAELIFWIVRATVNVVGILCVFSLYTQWKEEKNVNRRLRDLTMTSPMAHGYYTNIHIKTPLPGSLRAGYHNAAYLASETNLRQMQPAVNVSSSSAAVAAALAHRSRVERMASLQRSASSLSQLGPADSYRSKRMSVDFGNLSEFDTVLHRWQQKQQQQTLPGMAFGSMGIAGVGLDPDEPNPPSTGRYRTQSLLYIDDLDNYWNRPPLSRPISTALILNPKYQDANYTAPTFDRQSQFVVGQPVDNSALRRAHSMNDLNQRFSNVLPDVTLQKMSRQPFSYLPAYNSRNSLGAESDDLTRYKDVAL